MNAGWITDRVCNVQQVNYTVEQTFKKNLHWWCKWVFKYVKDIKERVDLREMEREIKKSLKDIPWNTERIKI